MPRDIKQIARVIAFKTWPNEQENCKKLLNYMISLDKDKDQDNIIDQLYNISTFLTKISPKMAEEILSPLSQNDEFTNDTLASIMGNIQTEFSEDYEKIISDTNKKETPSATILEEIEPKRVNRKKAKATVSETLNEKASHPLTYLLNRMEQNDISYTNGKIEITEDEKGEEVKYKNTVQKIGDKSVIEYKSNDKKIDNKVTADTQTNTITLSHKKDTDINKYLVAHSIVATIDYMKAKREVPFILNIDGKTDTYIDAAIKTLFRFSDAYLDNEVTDNEVIDKTTQEDMKSLRKNIESIKLYNITISKNEIFSIKTKEEFEDKIKQLKLENKRKKEEALIKATKELKQNNPNSQLPSQGNER